MGAVEESYARVESHLDTLGDVYSSYSTNQTTIAVDPGRYEREASRAENGSIDVYTKVTNDAGEILHVGECDGQELPSATAGSVSSLESTARAAVDEAVGLECTLDGLETATILGIHDADDDSREPIYHLAVVFEASVASDPVETDGSWQEGLQPDGLFA